MIAGTYVTGPLSLSGAVVPINPPSGFVQAIGSPGLVRIFLGVEESDDPDMMVTLDVEHAYGLLAALTQAIYSAQHGEFS